MMIQLSVCSSPPLRPGMILLPNYSVIHTTTLVLPLWRDRYGCHWHGRRRHLRRDGRFHERTSVSLNWTHARRLTQTTCTPTL